MNPTFRDKDFWLLFKTLENEDITAAKKDQFQSLLEADFTIHTEEEDFPPAVGFSFDCGPRYTLILNMLLDIETDKSLLLVDKQTGTEFTLGWWDLGGWHPYCLRLEELEQLCAYWQQHDTRWNNSRPWLLLSDFVGITTPAEGERLRTRDTVSLQENGCYAPQLITSLLEDGSTRESLLAEEAYQWSATTDLGWTFHSNEYNCYSIRNRQHTGSSCGSFPFQQWREMLDDIGFRQA